MRRASARRVLFMGKYMKTIRISIQILIITVSAIMLIWANCAKFNAGSIIGILLFGGIIVCTLLYKKLFSLIKRLWKHIAGKIAVISATAVVAFGVFLAVFFTVNMLTHIHAPIEDIRCVLVLGCQVRGETPSSMLHYRTLKAVELLQEFPDAVCVVSGGQGRGEAITEAEAMRRILVANGISEERIFLEDTSTSTAENFRNSKTIMDKLGITEGVAVVTSEYHQYRASLYAKRSGLNDTGHYSAYTSRYMLLNCWLREWGGLAATWLLGY